MGAHEVARRGERRRRCGVFFPLPAFGEGQGGVFLAKSAVAGKNPTPALPEVGEFSGMGFPAMEVVSWTWIAR